MLTIFRRLCSFSICIAACIVCATSPESRLMGQDLLWLPHPTNVGKTALEYRAFYNGKVAGVA